MTIEQLIEKACDADKRQYDRDSLVAAQYISVQALHDWYEGQEERN